MRHHHDDTRCLLEDQTLVLDHLPIQVWQFKGERTYCLVNACHAAFFGKTQLEIEGHTLEDLLPVDLAEACLASNREVIRSGQAVREEALAHNGSGEERLLAISKTPVIREDGTVEGVLCVAQDITEQRQAETRLSLSEENYRTLVETIDDLVVIGNAQGRLLYANPATVAKLGYSLDELTEMSILDLHPGWLRQEAQAIMEEMFAGHRQVCPLPLMSKQGSLLPVETRAWFGKWSGEDCVFGLCLDLSKEQESLQKFEKLFHRNPALMAINDIEERRFLDVNESFLRCTGYRAEEVLGKTAAELNLFPQQEEQDRLAHILHNYGKLEEVELLVRSKSGQLRTGLFSGDMVESQGKRYFLTVMVDITERKQAEDEREVVIAELKSALEQIKTLKGIFPICAKCKKIRDDRGYWQQVEAYISQRTDALFSHGLCPGCAEDLYKDHFHEEPDQGA